MKKRLVIGCGFLGQPLADSWRRGGDSVYVTTRNTGRAVTFSESGYLPIIADITDPQTLSELPSVDTCVIAVGMDRSRYSSVHEVYVAGLENVIDALPESTGQIIYVSSTGVYGNFDGDWVDEQSPTDPQREGGKACLAAEQLLQQSRFADRSTIIRMAGLYGGSRVPTRQSIADRQWEKLSPNGYLNLIHQDDAVAAIEKVADLNIRSELFLASDSHPSLRRDYYQFIADSFGLGAIPWDAAAKPDAESRSSSSKRISNRKLISETGLELRYPDFRAGLRDTLAIDKIDDSL